jgi:hypothetical protein
MIRKVGGCVTRKINHQRKTLSTAYQISNQVRAINTVASITSNIDSLDAIPSAFVEGNVSPRLGDERIVIPMGSKRGS